jgi:hypothetical protein
MRRRRRPISLSLSLFGSAGSRGLGRRLSRSDPLSGGWGSSCLIACSAGCVSAERVGDARKPGGVCRVGGVFPSASSSGLRALPSRDVRRRPRISRAVAFEEGLSRVYPARGVSVMQCPVRRHGRVPNTGSCRGLGCAAPERPGGASPAPAWRSLPVVTVVPGLRSRGRGSYVERRGSFAQDPWGSRRSSKAGGRR